ncbi:hypothetical protein M0R45_010238 [Rubus argutus]|uniref:BHLH domain-containing protein n=1 Tax=Rubus argutus TaxID=59490 RepID=A0AAW1Y6D8_RUBAR
MENNFFLNAGIPPSLHFEPAQSMPSWRSLSNAMEIQSTEQNCSTGRSPECFYNPNWDKSTDHQSVHFESALSSMVSSPVASNSNISNESFVIRELIGKLGSIGNNSGEISAAIPANNSYMGGGNASANTSCYTTPLNSPPKLNLQIMDHLPKEKLPKSMPLNSSVAEFSADPGFAERAAKFSCFGSRSFNGRTTQLGTHTNNSEVAYRSNQPMGNENKLPRTGLVPSSSTDLSSRKRKTASKGKAKDPLKGAEVSDISDLNAKRCKPNEGNGNIENGSVKAEEDTKGCTSSDEKQGKTGPKPPEPLKDYIHVRARRGQATDSHSLAERVRREKISERMKLLQDLVPGCNKVTGKALMLDEIINYVQSLQRQVEFLSMKLSSVNTRLDFNMDALMSKEIFQQQNNSLPHAIFPSDSSAQALYGHQQNPAHCSVDPLDIALCQGLGMQLPPLNAFSEAMPQYPAFGEDDLQTIVQMGFGQNPNKETEFQGSNQASHMKIEL